MAALIRRRAPEAATTAASLGSTVLLGVATVIVASSVLPPARAGELLALQATVALTSGVGRFGFDRVIVREMATSPRRGKALWNLYKANAITSLIAALAASVLGAALVRGDRLAGAIVAFVWTAGESARLLPAEGTRAVGRRLIGIIVGNLGRSLLGLLALCVLWIASPTTTQGFAIPLAGASVITAALAYSAFHTSLDTTQDSVAARSVASEIAIAAPLATAGMFSIFLTQGDTVMAGLLLPGADAAAYALGVKISAVLALPIYGIAFIATPRIGTLVTRAGEGLSVEAAIRRSVGLATAATGFMLVALLAGRTHLIGALEVGQPYQRGGLVACVLGVGILINCATGPAADYLAIAGNNRELMVVNAIAALSAAAVGWLALATGGGVMALAAAFAAAMAVQNLALERLVKVRLNRRSAIRLRL